MELKTEKQAQEAANLANALATIKRLEAENARLKDQQSAVDIIAIPKDLREDVARRKAGGLSHEQALECARAQVRENARRAAAEAEAKAAAEEKAKAEEAEAKKGQGKK